MNFDEYDTPVRGRIPRTKNLAGSRTAPPAGRRLPTMTTSTATKSSFSPVPIHGRSHSVSSSPVPQTPVSTQLNVESSKSPFKSPALSAPNKGHDLLSNLPYLRHLVQTFDPPHRQQLGVLQINLALIGGIRSGKSAFINAVVTALEDGDDVRNRAPVGGADVEISLNSTNAHDLPTTQSIERFDIAERVVLWDTWGWSGSEIGYNQSTIRSLLDGNLSSGWSMNRNPPSSDESDESESDSSVSETMPDVRRQMHGVLIFVPATEVLDADGYMSRAKRFVDIARRKGIQCLIVLSFVDRVDSSVRENVAGVFSSEAIQVARSTAASLLQVPLNTVYPCKAYYSEFARNPAIDALVLSVLKTALTNAGEMLRRRFNQTYNTLSTPVHDELRLTIYDEQGVQLPFESVGHVFAAHWSRWSELTSPNSYSLPPRQPWNALRRSWLNWCRLLANYLAVVLAVWLGFALWHIGTQPYLAAGLAAVAVLWLVLFHILPPTVLVRGFRINRRVKERLLLVAMAIALLALLRDVSFEPVAIMAVVVWPLLCLHSLFYQRAERQESRIDDKGI